MSGIPQTSGVIAEKYIPRAGDALGQIPAGEYEPMTKFARSSLLLVSNDGEKRDVSLFPGYRSELPDHSCQAVGYGDVLWKWNDILAKGGTGYDGVYQSTVGGKTHYYFWNNATNDSCDVTHKASVEFPIPLTDKEALWLTQASGLNPLNEACKTGAFKDDQSYFRFAFNQTQIEEVYEKRVELYREQVDCGDISPDRFDEILEALQGLRPPTHFYDGVVIFILGGAGAAAATGLGAALLMKLKIIGVAAASTGTRVFLPFFVLPEKFMRNDRDDEIRLF